MFGWLSRRQAPSNARVANPERMGSPRRLPAGLSTKLADQEDKWNAIAETIRFVAAVYRRGSETTVEVLRVDGAYLNNRHTLVLQVTAPKLVQHRNVGDHLEWARSFELPIEDLRQFEPLHPEFWRAGSRAYQSAIERGRQIAETL